MANMPFMGSPRGAEVGKSLKKKLLLLAGGQCAICHRQLRLDDEESGEFTHIADIAHIYPKRTGGERSDQERPGDLNNPDNLIPLCPYCHRMVDWKGVGARRWPVDKLRRLKSEHEAWIAFQRERPQEEPAAEPEPDLGTEPGAALIADRQSFRLPAEPRLERIDGFFMQQWSPDGDAVRCVSYAYAETGDASHAWVRRVAARDGSAIGARWRRELTDEAALLANGLPRLPGLPRLLAVEMTPPDVIVVTALPTVTSWQDRFGTGGMAQEAVPALFAGMATLCAALGALHDARLAHGSLDAAAILVDRHGDLVLRDLGHATARRAAARDDVMALARIVYQAVTGLPPLTGADGPPVAASVHNPRVPEPAARALAQALTGDLRDARVLAKRLYPTNRSRR
jgi:HNH endonuclease